MDIHNVSYPSSQYDGLLAQGHPTHSLLYLTMSNHNQSMAYGENSLQAFENNDS
jgi:hypothetical protein